MYLCQIETFLLANRERKHDVIRETANGKREFEVKYRKKAHTHEKSKPVHDHFPAKMPNNRRPK